MNRSSALGPSPSWENTRIGALDLEKVVRDIWKKWGRSESELSCSVSPDRIKLRIGRKSRVAVNWGFHLRFLIWTTAFLILPAGWFFELARILPKYVGMFGAMMIISGFGVLCRAQLESAFNTYVLRQLGERAGARAVALDDLLMEAVVALWYVQNRPFLGGVKSFLAFWEDEDNSLNKAVAEPIREALVDLYELEESQLENFPNGWDGWVQKDYYTSKIKSAYESAKEFQDAWFRGVALPSFIHNCALGASIFFLVMLGLVEPYLTPFLINLGR